MGYLVPDTVVVLVDPRGGVGDSVVLPGEVATGEVEVDRVKVTVAGGDDVAPDVGVGNEDLPRDGGPVVGRAVVLATLPVAAHRGGVLGAGTLHDACLALLVDGHVRKRRRRHVGVRRARLEAAGDLVDDRRALHRVSSRLSSVECDVQFVAVVGLDDPHRDLTGTTGIVRRQHRGVLDAAVQVECFGHVGVYVVGREPSDLVDVLVADVRSPDVPVDPVPERLRGRLVTQLLGGERVAVAGVDEHLLDVDERVAGPGRVAVGAAGLRVVGLPVGDGSDPLGLVEECVEVRRLVGGGLRVVGVELLEVRQFGPAARAQVELVGAVVVA